MTDTEKATQLGTVLLEIRKHEEELKPLLVHAKNIGTALESIGKQLQNAPFGVSDVEETYAAGTVSGGAYGDRRHLFDYSVIEKLEAEISAHARELRRLRSLKSSLGF